MASSTRGEMAPCRRIASSSDSAQPRPMTRVSSHSMQGVAMEDRVGGRQAGRGQRQRALRTHRRRARRDCRRATISEAAWSIRAIRRARAAVIVGVRPPVHRAQGQQVRLGGLGDARVRRAAGSSRHGMRGPLVRGAAARRPGDPRLRRMPRLLECVPNFSEGRRPEVIDAIAGDDRGDARGGPARSDLGRRPRPERADLRRTARPGAGGDASTRPSRRPSRASTCEHHEGQHPRIGALDVAPVRAARRHHDGEAIDVGLAARSGLASPSASTCRSTCTRTLPHTARSDGPRGHPTARSSRASRRSSTATRSARPTSGRCGRTRSAGATVAVGARPFLIAWNIQLDTDDLALATAHRRHHPGAGWWACPRVQALGMWLEDAAAASRSR